MCSLLPLKKIILCPKLSHIRKSVPTPCPLVLLISRYETRMCKERWWNDSDWRKPKCSEKTYLIDTLSRSDMGWPGIDRWPPWLVVYGTENTTVLPLERRIDCCVGIYKGNNSCLLWKPCKHTSTLCGGNVRFFSAKLIHKGMRSIVYNCAIKYGVRYLLWQCQTENYFRDVAILCRTSVLQSLSFSAIVDFLKQIRRLYSQMEPTHEAQGKFTWTDHFQIFRGLKSSSKIVYLIPCLYI
jgi:hypothetical protein